VGRRQGKKKKKKRKERMKGRKETLLIVILAGDPSPLDWMGRAAEGQQKASSPCLT